MPDPDACTASGGCGGRARVCGRRAVRAAAGGAGVCLVDLFVEARGQRREDRVLLCLGQLAGRHRGVQVGLGSGRERRLETVHGLAVGRRDRGECLACGQLRAQIRGRDADVRRGRAKETGPPPGPPCP